MIAFLRGKLVGKQPPAAIIDVHGMGYEVETPMSTFYELPGIGEEVTLLTHFLVREDAQQLYGFATEQERSLFRNLLRVSGVGARIALAILSGTTVDGFRRCIEFEDVQSLVKVPGIGRKTAERLIVEMRDRLGDSESAPASGPKGRAAAVATADPKSEAFHALLALGYRDAEARKLLAKVQPDGDAPTAEEYIRHALKQAAG
jgi:Holliday junction DNA helicase RuvA